MMLVQALPCPVSPILMGKHTSSLSPFCLHDLIKKQSTFLYPAAHCEEAVSHERGNEGCDDAHKGQVFAGVHNIGRVVALRVQAGTIWSS